MSLLRRLQLFYRTRLLGRVIAAALLLATSLAAPASAAGILPPSFQGRGVGGVRSSPPLAPQNGCGVVINNSDNAPGSLRWTVGCVAAGATVAFDPSLAGQTIVLTGTEIAITQPIAIDGSGAPGIIVDAGNTSRVFNITASGPVTLTALTLQHGNSNVGGAVFDNVSQPLVLNSVRVLSSTVVAGTGGGLFAAGPLTLTNSDFISDTSTSNGGGVVAGSTAVVTGGRFERDTCTTGGCSGGAVYGFSSLTVSGTQFLTNTSLSHGGAAYTFANAVVTGGTFQGNQCSQSGCFGGGLYANTTLTLTNTDFTNNLSTGNGGGAFAQGAALLTNGSFQDNQCTAGGCLGGGLDVSSTVTLNGTSFISNTSVFQGGGASVNGAAVLTGGSFQGNKCTGALCTGGGLYAIGILTMIGTNFINNFSVKRGGGAYAQGGGVLTNDSFQGNQCTDVTICFGGGLYALGPLSLIGTDFISNISISSGGGAYIHGSVVLTDGLFQGNQCTHNFCGGGGLLGDFTLTLTGTQFISNTSGGSSGGVDVQGAAVLTNGIFQGNQCTQIIVSPGQGCLGGGLYAGGTLTLTGTQFISNTSTGQGGGAWAQGNALLTNDRFDRNSCTNSGCLGGGLFANSTALVLGSSFSGNQSAGDGGGVSITATSRITLANVSLSGNMAAGLGGGLFAGGTSRARLWNVTVADNQAASGGGIAAAISATLGVTNTIVSNNSGGNCAGTIAAGTHNLEWPAPAACATAGPTAGFSTANPLLAPLALNAPGTTLTQALLPGSAARDHGDPVSCANSTVNNLDQRGVVRPDPGSAPCDIGAYEAGPPDWAVFLPLLRN